MTVKENKSLFWGWKKPESRVMTPGEEVVLGAIEPGLMKECTLLRVVNNDTIQIRREFVAFGSLETEVLGTRYKNQINDRKHPLAVNVLWGLYRREYTWEETPRHPTSPDSEKDL